MNSDAKTWFDGKKNVLFVHAHPDDETIATGGVIAALGASGSSPSLLTLTRGERGEIRKEAEGALTEAGSLTALRVLERERSVKELGLELHEYLGMGEAQAVQGVLKIYEDSGMQWGPDGLAEAAADSAPEALTKQPAHELLNAVIAYAVSVGADAIVSYDAIGGYGHPDHVLAHNLARAVAHGLEIDFWEIDHSCDESESYDISEWLPQKVGALRAYQSQLEVLDEKTIKHVGGQEQVLPHFECFRRVL